MAEYCDQATADSNSLFEQDIDIYWCSTLLLPLVADRSFNPSAGKHTQMPEPCLYMSRMPTK